MSAGTAIVLVGIAGGAIFIVLRNQQQQQAAIAAAAAAAAPAPAAGGVSGLATRVFKQWEGDPLGIKNAKAVASGVGTVVTNAVHSITSLF